jgi:ABC-type uncharacterized transport system involved in gliding motility auxiliary subunit
MDNNKLDNTSEENVESSSEPQNLKTPIYKRRSFKYGSMATAFIAIFVVIVLLVNIGLSVLTARYPISIDLTKSHAYDITSTTMKFLDNIKQPITIKVFATQSEMEGSSDLVTPMKIIEQYPKYNKNISIQYIDFNKNPTAVAQYSDSNIAEGDIVVTTTGSDGKEHYKYIANSDLLITNTDQTTGQQTVEGNQAEQQIDSAIQYVTSTTHPTVLFTSGHNEADSSSLQTLLKSSNYDIQTVDTATSAISESASAIAIVAPSVDFSSQEITKIDTFLKNGGNYGKTAFIFLDPRLKKLPNIDEYASTWGIQVDSGVVYDETNSFDNTATDPVASTVDADTVGKNVSSSIGTDVRIAMPLTLLFDSKDVRATKSVIQTGDTSAVLLNLSGKPSSADKKGPFTVMALATWGQSENSNGDIQKSNLVVSGSYEIADSDLLAATNKNNAKVLVGITDTLTAKAPSINVPSKLNDSSQLTLTTAQRLVIALLFLLVIPLLILALGLFQWLRRRHL